LKKVGLGAHYVVHDSALFYENVHVPWTAAYIQAKGDPIADLYEDMGSIPIMRKYKI
jgi:spore coat protein JC